jgi:hypothetical protein
MPTDTPLENPTHVAIPLPRFLDAIQRIRRMPWEDAHPVLIALEVGNITLRVNEQAPASVEVNGSPPMVE